MTKILLLFSILLMVLSSGCTNPSGGSVVAYNHTPLLDPPAAFQFTQVRASNGNVEIVWQASTRADNYEFFIGTSSSEITTPVPACSGNKESCQITGLDPDTIYYLDIKATNAAGSKKVTSTRSVLSVGSFTITSSSVGDKTINLTWDNSNNATSYNVVYGTSPGLYPNTVTNVTSPYVLSGLTNGLRYYVRIVAVNSNNGSATSNNEINHQPFGPLAAPTGLALTAVPGQIALDWNDLSGATSYKVFRGTTAGSLTELASGITSSSYTDSTTTDGTTYFYALKAFNGFDSILSSSLSARSISAFNVTSTVAGPAPTQVTLNWPATTGAATYDIQYGTNAGALNLTSANVTSPLLMTGLTGGVPYYFKVVAKNAIGNGTTQYSSNQLSATPIAAIAAPTGLVATASPSSVALTWSAVAGATNYKVYRGLSAGSLSLLDSSVATNSYVDPTVANGTTYYYAVRSFNGLDSADSSQVSIRPISSLSLTGATVATFSSANLTWGSATGAATYDIRYGTSPGIYTNTSVNRSSPFVLTGLSASTTYYIAVRANNTIGTGTSVLSNEMSLTTTTQFPTISILSYPAIDSSNKTAYTVSGACSENTRTVTVNVGGVTSTPTCSALAWTATLNVSAVADSASVSITATHTNSGGNSSNASRTVVKDATNPIVAITSSPAINNANKAAYVVSGTCNENTRIVSIVVGGITATPTCTSSAWTATLNVSALSDSLSVIVTADLNDAAGNSATQATTNIVKDTSNPSVAISSSPLVNNANKTAYTVSGTCSETGRNVTVNVGSTNTSTLCSLLTWSATLNVSGNPDSATLLVTADHTDAAGNSAVQAGVTVLKDTTNPTVAITSSPVISNANKAVYPVSGTCSENTRTVSVNVGGVTATPNCTTLMWSATLDVTALADGGAIPITANHTDAAGNSATQASTTVVKSSALPTVTISSAPSINNSNKAAYPIAGTCSENTRIVSISVGDVTATPTCSALAWSTTLNVSAIADSASVAVTADHIDSIGNAAIQVTTSVIKDILIPTVSILSSPSINNLNKTAYPVSGACSENARSVSVSVGGVTATPSCSSLTWSATLNVSALADSVSVSITANHTDTAGNSANQSSATVVKDTTNPTVAITSAPAINNNNKTAYPVSGTCNENSRTVSVNVGGVTATPTCTTLTWSASLDVSVLADGASISITANHTDAAGNSAAQASTTVAKDTSNPTVSITSSPLINNANKNAYTVSGTCSETGQTVTINIGSVNTTNTCTLLTWSVTVNVSGNPDSASLLITADHIDAAGNTAVQAGTTVLKDTTLPTVAITSSPMINFTNKAAYVVSGTCSENTRSVSVNVAGVTSTPTCTTLTWSATLNVSAVADGASVSITANHTDAVGNSATQASTTVVKDTSLPTVAISASPIINNSNKAAYTVSGTCSENTRAVSISVGGVTSTPTCTALAWSATLNVTAIPDSASVSITADHADSSGNTATQATTTVLKDTSNPTVAVTSSPLINNANKAAYVISGTCSENTRAVSISVGGVTSTPPCTTLAWSATLNVTTVADGASVSITANHTDAAGNSATQASATAVKDTSNPTVAITSSAVINNANKAAYVVSGTCSENSMVVSINVGGVTATPTCTTLAWSTTLDATTVSDSASVSITANHSDVSGNSATQASTSVLKDTALPTVAITSSPVINNANKAAYVISGTCSENTRSVSINVGGVSATPTCTTLAWSATLNVTAVGDGSSIAITANHTDAAANSATQASSSVVKDTVLPTVAITSSPDINNGNNTAYPISGTCSENTRIVSVSIGGVTANPTCTTLAWSATLNVSGVADAASIAITANHSDAAANSATQASTTVVKNTGLPTVAITSSPAVNNANKAAYVLSGTCSENTRIVSINVGGITASPTCTTLTWSATLNVTAVADGASVAITADHDNSVGSNATQAATTVLKDTSIPTVAITSSPLINSANKAAYIVSGTCSENTRSVAVNVGGVTSTPTCTALTWSATLNVTAVADGASISVTANHTDAAGNPATQASTTVVKDAALPTVAITSSPVVNIANKAAYTVSGTCSENTQTVLINVGGVTSNPTCSALTWSATLNVTAVGDGSSIAITANHDDAAGNSATMASTTILKDTIAPTVAITSSPAINNTNKAVYPVAGTCSENTRTVSVNVGGVTANPTCTTLTWSTTLNVTAVSDGASVSVTANHTDAGANNATQSSSTVVKDTAIPTVAITSSPAINNANKAAYAVSGTCSENTRSVTVSVGGVSATPTCTTLAWSATLDVTAVSDGASIAVTANHSDVSGNSATQASSTVVKDTVIPTVAITSSPAINNSNKAAYPISGTCSENTRSVSVSVGGVSATATCAALAWSTTLDVTAVADGASVSVLADHTDASGNNALQATSTIAKDTGLPTVAISSAPVINNANKAAYIISGTCSEETRSVSINVGGATATPVCTSLTWSASLNVTGVTDGASIAVTANHSDVSGNAATEASTSVLKDTSAPTVAITSAPLINNANQSAYSVSGTCSENARSVAISVGGVTATPTCTALAWSTTLDVTAVTDGASISITANHTDAAGNNATQASTTVLKDTSAPNVAVTSSTVINNTNKAAYPVSGTCSENTRTVSASVGGVTATPTCTALAWSTSVNVTAVADGASVTITANHSDSVGNAASQASTTVLKDTVIPTVAITSSPAISNANKAAYPVSGTCSENTRTVSVSVGGVTATPSCTTLAWTATLNVTAVADGASISITANHTDAAGNAATQASTTVVKDATPPTVAITSSPLINNANKASYPISGTCSENSRTVSVDVGGVTATPTCTTLAWSTTLNLTAVVDSASVSATANHTDVYANAATQASTTIVKDTVIPTVAITSSPAINNANKNAYPISGTCSENTRTVSVNVGGVAATPTCTALAWSTTLNVSGVADGPATAITANHTDAAGNAATQASTTVVKDASNPTVAITSSPVISNSNKTAYTVSGTCSETGQTVVINVGSVNTSDTCTLLTWTATVDVSGNPDSSTLLITADHTDVNGNTAVQAGITVTKDTAVPTVAITSAPIINNANKAAYTVSGTCSENTRAVSVNIGGIAATPACSSLTWSTGAINVTAAADSLTLAITANHTDSAGNAATQASTTVIKDTSNPTVAITSSPGINDSNKTAYTVSGTCSENTRTVTVNVGGVAATPTCSALTWTTGTLNVSGVADSATVTITANHTDSNGNSATQASTTVVKDSAFPTVALSSAEPATTSGASWVVRATFNEAVTGMAITDFVIGNGSASAFTAVSTTLYDITVTPAGAGSVTVDLASNSATDAAGNGNTAATQLSRTHVTPAVLTFAVTSTHDFGSVNVGGSAEVTVIMNKSGMANATSITEIGLAAPFTFKGGAYPGTGGTCTTTISSSCSIVLLYTPTAAAVHNDAVQIQYNNGAILQSVSRNLTGTGVVIVPTHTSISGPTGIMINQCIPYTINSVTSAGVNGNVSANQTINLVVNNGTGTFYSNNTCATTATSAIITAGTSSTIVYFKSTTTAQNLTLVFNPASLVSSTHNVTTASTPVAISFTTPVEMQTNDCNPIVVNLVDANGTAVGKSAAVQLNLAQNGAATFYSDSNCLGVATSLTYAAYVTTKTVYVKDATQQTVNINITDNAALLTAKNANINFVNALVWWDNNYLKRIPIILNNKDQPTAFTDLPVMIKLNTSRISYSDILAGGADIRFTLDDHTTALKYEIESWNSSGDSFIWVKIPSMAASADKIIYMYYNNSSAVDGQDATNTWTGFSGVWNMKKSGVNYVDSTGSGKTGVAQGTVTDLTGPSANAISVNGASSLDVSYNLALIIGKTSTLSFWMKTSQAGSNTVWQAPGITGVEQSGGGNDIFFGWISASGTIRISTGNGTNTSSNFIVNDNSWRHITMSRHETTGAVKFYVNGVLNGSGTSDTGAKTTPFSQFGAIGDTGGAPQYFNGSMDGIRLKAVIETDARIKAEYKFGTESNVTYGSAESF